MRYSINLTANQRVWFPYRGKVVQFVSLGAASLVRLEIGFTGSDNTTSLGDVSSLFKYGPTEQPFAGFALTTTVDATLDVLVADDDAGFPDTNQVSIITSQLPLPVETRNANDLAAAPTYTGAVAVNDTGVLLLAKDTTYRRVVLRNSGGSPVALSRGAAATAYASCATVIQPGETYFEERFAGVNLDFRGRCDVGLSSTIVVEGWK